MPTPLSLISDSLGILNITLANETTPNALAQQGLRFLNRMIGQWALRGSLLAIVHARERFDLVANQGGPTTPYTIGVGGNFNTARPQTQASIEAANLILTATSPEVRVPIAIYTNQAAFANQVPTQTSVQPTSLYYRPTYVTSGLGAIEVWPVPTTSDNDLELQLLKPLAQFADTTTSVNLPDGWDEALVYNLARRWAGTLGAKMTTDDLDIARNSFETIQRANLNLQDLSTDAIGVGDHRPFYNILSGNG